MTNTFFWPNRNTEYYLVFRNHRIPNIVDYLVLRKFKDQIPNTSRYEENTNTNTNSTIRSNYSNTKYWIPNSIQNFGKNETKIKIFFPYKTFCSENMWSYLDRYSVQLFEYPNTIWGEKNLNTEYRILFGIGKILISNTNTTIRSHYLNSILIPNYLSHPV